MMQSAERLSCIGGVTVNGDAATEVLLAYGAHPDVLFDYGLTALRARIVRDVVKLKTPGGNFALKKSFASQTRLDYIYAFSEYMHHTGYPSVPRMVRTRYGDSYVLHPTGLYYVTAWTAGRELDITKPHELVSAIQTLAGWHLSARGFIPPLGHSPMLPFERRLTHSMEVLQQAIQEAEARQQKSPFEKLLLAAATELTERTNAAMAACQHSDFVFLQRQAEKESLMCHGNYAKSTVLFDGEAFRVQHYDKIYQGHPVYDVATFLQRYLPSHRWDADILCKVVDSYLDVAGESHHFRQVLYTLLGAPVRALQGVVWYLQRSKEWEEEDYVDYLEASLELEEPREAARFSVKSRQVDPAHRASTDWSGRGNMTLANEVVNGALNGEDETVSEIPVNMESPQTAGIKIRINGKEKEAKTHINRRPQKRPPRRNNKSGLSLWEKNHDLTD